MACLSQIQIGKFNCNKLKLHTAKITPTRLFTEQTRMGSLSNQLLTSKKLPSQKIILVIMILIRRFPELIFIQTNHQEAPPCVSSAGHITGSGSS